ncbi:Stk1 family PASTA domain-containing Ser/Thr kinase [Streptomyces sp. NPDC048442]|uniref:Stk1 family PASTA domain-containing Ser/Thr kinase n=1 Tax=Streptomyces sp. NPDC048442 TaxID=3154823 RepID=UPI00343754F4
MEEPRRLGGRYELGSVLGRGGMAEVYIAQDTRLGRTVAVKTLRVDLARDPSFQARFRREAQSSASLNHPAIVAVYDTGEDYVDGVSLPYIVMEYVDGSTLRELLHSGRKLLPERTLEMTVGILQALEYSHRAQIVHRDIKPANVMLTRNGQVKVMDFGIARAMGDSGMTMTQTSAVIGTAQYLSPEQAKGEQVDARSDLYSTGCLLYELLAVRPPFIGDSPVAVAYQHVREEPQPPSNFDPEITPDMDAIVLKALTKDPDYRYQSADEMRADIEACLDGRPVAATAALGAVGYGGYDGYGSNDQPTTALRQAGHGGGQTAMMPPVGNGGDGYGNGTGGYDEPAGRRRQQPKKSNTSTILLALAGILVLVGAVLIGNSLFNGEKKPQTTDVPKLVGQTYAAAQQSAERIDVILKRSDAPCADQEKGNVCSQNPATGKIKKGETITVVVSTGAPKVEIPDVMEQTQKRATERLKEAGFTPRVKQADSEQTEGTVIKQSPKGGESAEKGSDVTITIAKKKQLAVPDLSGQTYEAAEQTLKNLGFQSVSKAEQESEKTPNTVIDQNPKGNTQALPGTAITLIVAKPKPQETPPPDAEQVQIPADLVGKTYGEAKGILEGLGLTVQPGPGGKDKDDARVVAVNPGGGTMVAKGSAVAVTAFGGGGGDHDNGLFGN